MTTPKNRADFLTLRPYKCVICEGLIGIQSDTMLYIGAAGFDKSVTITCMYCGRYNFFRSNKEKITKNNGRAV